MATIRNRAQLSGIITYQVRWRESGRQRSETFARHGDAVKFCGLVDANGQAAPDGWISGQGYAPAKPATITVADWCARSIDARSGILDQTRANYRGQLRQLGALGDIDLADLTRTDVMSWINTLELAPKTIANVHGLLSSCLNDAERDGHIPRNPAIGLRLPARHGPTSREIVALTGSEIQLITSHTDPRYRLVIETLAGTGMRQGEAFALQTRHVNIRQRRISIVQALQRSPGGAVIGAPKTRRSVRSLAITAALADALVESVDGRDPDAYVFTTIGGARVHPARFRSHTWAPAIHAARRCEAHADADEPCCCPGTLKSTPTPHDLRHSHASALINAGVPLAKIQRRLGHESISTTVNTYGHMLPDSEDEVIAALERG